MFSDFKPEESSSEDSEPWPVRYQKLLNKSASMVDNMQDRINRQKEIIDRQQEEIEQLKEMLRKGPDLSALKKGHW